MIRRCLVAWCLVGWLATPAFAQDTGGSFGGGDWGSGSSDDDSSDYGSSSSDYGSSSDDDDDDSSDYGGSSDDLGGGGGDDAWTCPVMGVLFFGFMFLVLRSSDRERRRSLDQASRAWTGVDVAALRLGLDWRARKHVQGRLEELASSGDTTTKAGRARLLRETVALLEGARIAWLYTDVVNHQPMNQAQAQGIFQQLAVDALKSTVSKT